MTPFQWLSDGLSLSSWVGKNDGDWRPRGYTARPGEKTEGSPAQGLGASLFSQASRSNRLHFGNFCFFTFFSLEYLLCFLLKT